MRAFGIFAAFAAFTSVFAAPLAAPAPATGNSIAVKARDDTVPASIANAVLDLQASVNTSVSGLQSVLDTAGPDLGTVVSDLAPYLEQLVSDLTSAAGKAGLAALGNLFGGSASDLTLAQIGAILATIEQDIANILCEIATLIGPNYPQTAATIETIITILNALTQGVSEVTGDLSEFLPNLGSLIGPILGDLGIQIPGLSK